MAWHRLRYTAKARASSLIENVFNQWKKFLKAKLKRALLNEAFHHVMNHVEKRIISDVHTIEAAIAKGHFIDMRKEASLIYGDRQKHHKKKTSTLVVYEKENAKLQDKECCPWPQAMSLGDNMWLLQERVSKHERSRVEDCVIVHIVILQGFLWKDCPENVPPTCLTCPTFLNTKCPCVGIQRALLNVEPPAGCDPLPKWLLGKGIFKPEIFNNRLRIDKDPTVHLPKYLQCAVSQHRVPAPRGASIAAALSNGMATDADVLDMFKDMTSRIAKMPANIRPKANGEMKRFFT